MFETVSVNGVPAVASANLSHPTAIDRQRRNSEEAEVTWSEERIQHPISDCQIRALMPEVSFAVPKVVPAIGELAPEAV